MTTLAQLLASGAMETVTVASGDSSVPIFAKVIPSTASVGGEGYPWSSPRYTNGPSARSSALIGTESSRGRDIAQPTVVFASGRAATLTDGAEAELADGGVVGEGWELLQPSSAIISAVSPRIPKRAGTVFVARKFKSLPEAALHGVEGRMVVTVAESTIRQQSRRDPASAKSRTKTADPRAHQLLCRSERGVAHRPRRIVP